MARSPVSVLMPVKNEEANLRRSLPALTWADEIFVVDSHSTDRTLEVAESFGAKAVQFHFNGTYPKKKNWALDNLPFRNEWVLIVDADEVITAELASEIHDAVKKDGVDGCYINRRFMFMGRWIRHCGYYPSWNLRLFKHPLGRYEKLGDAAQTNSGDNEVHEHILLEGKTEKLKNAMLHFAYPDVSAWVEKHNRYSNWEAALHERFVEKGHGDNRIGRGQSLKRSLKRVYLRLPLRYVFRFIYAYFLRLGFLDGKPGFILCTLLSFYDFLSYAKVHEMKAVRNGVSQPANMRSSETVDRVARFKAVREEN